MKTTKNILYSLFTVLGVCTASAQQDLMLSQEIFSRVNKNPAATGNTNDVDIFLHGRLQWAGVDNGPRTGVLNVTNYVDKIKSGMGFTCAYDKMGVAHSTTNMKLVYAYQLDLSDKYVLSLGVGAGINIGYFDLYQNTVDDYSEVGTSTLLGDNETEVSPDFDFGAELSNPYWTLGASITHLTKNEMTTFESERHYYLYGTSLIPLCPKWELAPTVSYMHRNKTNVMEIGSLAFYDRFLWGGITLRPDLNEGFNPSMLIMTLGVEWNKFRFGYSYDLGLGSNERIGASTHEVILSYGIDKTKWKK
ncbi:MAG: PorP/SprF family type IX secretion system membrane protein [Paludibacteraceae bacterium]|nr:PorP/SprF family type IX secretion system membrane protein [Paludibacteraceae bacterium]MBR6043226.1 PorP/SprF family type IX secretion system membrane protein [Paludibacteraceae bacterium]